MKTRKKILLLIFAFSFSINLFSQKISDEIVIIKEIENEILINFKLPNYRIIDTNLIDFFDINQTFNLISVSDESFGITYDEGYPQLPQLTINLAIPDSSFNFDVSYSNLVTEEISLNHKILPNQIITNNTTEFVINQDFYNSDGSLYFVPARLSDKYFLMCKAGISLTIFPFLYNPSENKLTIIKSGDFTITYSQPLQKQTINIPYEKELFISNFYQNYTPTNLNKSFPTYLIITPPRFENILQFFANFKSNLGYEVTIVNTNTTGTSNEDIKNYISDNMPVFVLLVGDVADIPAYGDYTSNDEWDPTTDLHYSLLLGDDYFPDVFLGRFSVSTVDELQNLIYKNIFMETNIHTFDKKAKFLASDDWHGITHDWWCKKFEESHDNVLDFFSNYDYENETVYSFSEGATYQDGLDALDDAPLFFLYSGHGDQTSLSTPFDYSFVEINSPLRTHLTFPLGFTFACLTGNYGNSQCYGEAWIRSRQGGVSYLGCSVFSIVEPDIKLESSIFSNLGVNHLGFLVDYGKMYFWSEYHTVLNNRRWERYMKSYNLLGDPTFYYLGIGCINDFVFSNDMTFNAGDERIYRASNSITVAQGDASFIVKDGASVTLVAGDYIELLPGFETEEGAFFEAYIAPCEGKTEQTTPEKSLNVNTIQKQETITKVIENNVNIYPNPFTTETTIEYNLSENSDVKIEIFDLLGEIIYSETLNDVYAGTQQYKYSATNLVTGIYVVKIHTNQYQEVKFIFKQ